MSNLEKHGEVHSADVIIIGGGLGGLILANRVKELNCDLDVMIVEKSTTGFAGSKANKGAGVLWVLDETDDVDKFMSFFAKEVGHGLEDQDMVRKFALTSLPLVRQLERWGIEILRDENGKLSRIEDLPLWALCAYDLDILLKLRKLAKKNKVKEANKTQIVELLKEGDRVVGAVGFDVETGQYRIFKGKSVIIANGSCNWMATNMWFSGRGDGIAASYRAGAEMRNAEFSNFYNIGLRGNHSSTVGGQYALYNDLGEYLAPKYCADFEPDFDINIFLGMEKEVMEGRGPIRLEETEIFVNNPIAAGGFLFKWDRKEAGRFWGTLMGKEARLTADQDWRPEVVPLFLGEMASIKTNVEMQSTLEGLWAVGDANKGGSGFGGATPAPNRLRGTGLAWAGVSALLAAESVAAYLTTATEPVVNEEQVIQLKEKLLGPMNRPDGIHPREAISKLKEVITPPRFGIRKSEDRIQEALNTVETIEKQIETSVSPHNDFHMLGLFHDLRNMNLCAKIYYKAAIARKETRGWHVMDEYPEKDDQNWRKWIIVKQENDEMKVSTEKIPFETYT